MLAEVLLPSIGASHSKHCAGEFRELQLIFFETSGGSPDESVITSFYKKLFAKS